MALSAFSVSKSLKWTLTINIQRARPRDDGRVTRLNDTRRLLRTAILTHLTNLDAVSSMSRNSASETFTIMKVTTDIITPTKRAVIEKLIHRRRSHNRLCRLPLKKGGRTKGHSLPSFYRFNSNPQYPQIVP